MADFTPSYLASRTFTIEAEVFRLRGLVERTQAALPRCTRQDDRDCLQADLDVRNGLLTMLERAKASPTPNPTKGR